MATAENTVPTTPDPTMETPKYDSPTPSEPAVEEKKTPGRPKKN